MLWSQSDRIAETPCKMPSATSEVIECGFNPIVTQQRKQGEAQRAIELEDTFTVGFRTCVAE